MDGIEFVLLIEEFESFHVPRDMTGVGHDLQIRHVRDESALVLVEIAGVVKRQSILCFRRISVVWLEGAFPFG